MPAEGNALKCTQATLRYIICYQKFDTWPCTAQLGSFTSDLPNCLNDAARVKTRALSQNTPMQSC